MNDSVARGYMDMIGRVTLAAAGLTLAAMPATAQQRPAPRTWVADNGNGTFTNPLFQDELSDPDIIRVGTDYYLVGSTMHTMPGLPVLHSKDLINWTLASYAFDRLNLGPEFEMKDGKEVYGNGIWAPAIRYHNGTFYIFVNVNNHGMQVFSATNPRGPWTRKPLGGKIYDLSVLFDDDGRVWAVHGRESFKELRNPIGRYIMRSNPVFTVNMLATRPHVTKGYSLTMQLHLIMCFQLTQGTFQSHRLVEKGNSSLRRLEHSQFCSPAWQILISLLRF